MYVHERSLNDGLTNYAVASAHVGGTDTGPCRQNNNNEG